MSPRAKAKPVRRTTRARKAAAPEVIAPTQDIGYPGTLSLAEFRLQVKALKGLTTVTSYGKPIGQWVPHGAVLRLPVDHEITAGVMASVATEGKDQTGEQLRAMHRRQASAAQRRRDDVLAKAFPQRPSKT